MSLRPLEICLQCGDRLQSSESNVYSNNHWQNWKSWSIFLTITCKCFVFSQGVVVPEQCISLPDESVTEPGEVPVKIMVCNCKVFHVGL